MSTPADGAENTMPDDDDNVIEIPRRGQRTKSPGAGVEGVSDVTRRARREAQRLRDKMKDPAIGQPLDHQGRQIPPGQWEPGADGLPPGSPIGVLGKDGATLYLTDSLGQLRPVTAEKLGMKTVQEMVGDRQAWLYWAFPGYDRSGKLVRWRNELFVETIAGAAHRRGIWNAVDRVRGLGMWLDDNLKLIYHTGEDIFREGRLDRPQAAGEIEGYFYPRRPPIEPPWEHAITSGTNPALDIIRTLQTWQWERPHIDPFLLLGWIGAAFLSGALPWRPTCFVIGDRAVGKTTLQVFLKDILGRALLDTADTTPAGIYQRVRQDALPIAIDELEAAADNVRQQAVIKLARLAASGAKMTRGAQNAADTPPEFHLRSCFFFSAINPPALPPQDLSRMVCLNLRRLPDVRATQPVERLKNNAVGRMLLRQLIDNFHRFPATLAAYRAALAIGKHDGRGQDTYGVVLACADLLLGPELMTDLGFPVDPLDDWATWLRAADLPELQDAHENWRSCLTHLLTSRVEAWREGQRRTVGLLLEHMQLAPTEPNYIDLVHAAGYLYQAGLGLIDWRKTPGLGLVLAVPNSGPLLAALFRDTVFAGAGAQGGWASALRQGPPDVVLTKERVAAANPKRATDNWNVVKVNGVAMRCTLVSLDGWRKLTEGS